MSSDFWPAEAPKSLSIWAMLLSKSGCHYTKRQLRSSSKVTTTRASVCRLSVGQMSSSLQTATYISEILGRRRSHDGIATLASLIMLRNGHRPIMAAYSQRADGRGSGVEISSRKDLGQGLRIVQQDHVRTDADDRPISREQVIGCERELAVPSLPAYPERAGGREPRPWDRFQRVEAGEVDHPAELDEDPSC